MKEVSFRYPGCAEPALRRIGAEFSPNTVTVLTGRLGGGCSTLLLTIAGFAPRITGGERDGEVETLGYDPSTPEGRVKLAGRVGFLLPTPWTQLTGMAYSVREEVAFGPANLGWSRVRIGESVERSLALVGAAELAGRDPRTLSGGQLQRVMLAAVAATEPAIYLLDEPTQELDPEGARTVYQLLPQLATDATVIIATTDVDRALDVADRALLLERGVVVADGDPQDVLGGVDAIESGCSTTVAAVAWRAGCPGPLPLTVDAAVRRYGP